MGRKGDYDKVQKLRRTAQEEVLYKNIRRVCEGIRVCEEVVKSLKKENIFLSLKAMRFEIYDIEKDLKIHFCRKKR